MQQSAASPTLDTSMMQLSVQLVSAAASMATAFSANNTPGPVRLVHNPQVTPPRPKVADSASDANALSAAPAAPASSPIYSPGDIPRFLTYAEKKLGVKNAARLSASFDVHGYGPDILSNISDADIRALGVAPGDAIRLKKGSEKWWKEEAKKEKAAGKRKRADTIEEPGGSSSSSKAPARKEIRYEKRYTTDNGDDDGAFTFWGPPFTETGEDMNGRDYRMFYFDETTSQMLPVPRGFSAELDGSNEEEDPFA